MQQAQLDQYGKQSKCSYLQQGYSTLNQITSHTQVWHTTSKY